MIADQFPRPAVLARLVPLHSRGADVPGNLHETFRLGVRQRTQQSRIYNAEDCGIGSDAQRQRKDNNPTYQGRSTKKPQSVSNVQPKIHGHTSNVLAIRNTSSDGSAIAPKTHIPQ